MKVIGSIFFLLAIVFGSLFIASITSNYVPLKLCYKNIDTFKRTAESYAKKGNQTEAIKWYQKAAEDGDAESETRLGDAYQLGKGVPQNWTETYFWYKIGEENGGFGGMLPQEVDRFWDSLEINKHLTPKEIASVEKKVSDWKPACVPQTN